MSEVKQQKKIKLQDFDAAAQFIVNEYKRRKKSRSWLEKKMKIVDRQLRMEPDVKYKKNANGDNIATNSWMPECELPNQSQTLELLNSEARKMMFPDNGPWFQAKAYADDAFLEFFKSESAFIVGSDIDPPSIITNDNINSYVQGFLADRLKQFAHDDAWELICSESFKYGLGIGRIRKAMKSVFIHDARETYNKSSEICTLVPIPLKNFYLDDKTYDYMANGASIGPSSILRQTRKLADIVIEAKKSKKEPKDSDDYMSGGWITSNLKDIEPDKNGFVELLEYEGDIVFSSNENDDIFIPNAVITVLCGKESEKVVKIEYSEFPISSYILIPYQKEHIDCVYGTSPLMKGMPIQTVASESLNRFMQSAILSTQPPIKFDRDDAFFRTKGGPQVYPNAQWATNGDVEVIKIGNPEPILAGYQSFLTQYSDVTGVTAARLGAQTVSHTTAYAKDQEIERGTIRTVDFVRSIMKHQMSRWLEMAYHISREEMDDEDVIQIYMDEYGAFVNVRKQLLPAKVSFTATGSIGPQETIARQQQRMSAIMQAIQLNQLAVQAGLAQPLNYEAIQRQLLREGGVTDVDALTTNPSGVAGQPQLPAVGQGAGATNAIPIALQGLQQGIQQ